MVVQYKGHEISPAVNNRPAGVPFTPRVALTFCTGPETLDKILDWPDECAEKEEAEKLAIKLAKSAIDAGLGFT